MGGDGGPIMSGRVEVVGLGTGSGWVEMVGL